MPKQQVRTEQEIRERSDPRWTELPQPCMHCKNLISVGSQFEPAGWTCSAFPEEISYDILTLREPHTAPRAPQVGTDVFDPVIYTEEGTERKWHYTADAKWRYLDGGPK